ncbi:unnamed protein product, partial [Rotaria sp. Silwood2]
MKFYAENLSIFDKTINSEIDKTLELYKKKQTATVILQLTVILEETDVGARIISEHSCLAGEDWRKRREKMENQDNLDYVLEHLDGDNIDKNILRERYNAFREIYDKLISTNLKLLNQKNEQERHLEGIISNTKIRVGKVVQKTGAIQWNYSLKTMIHEILAYIFAVWTLANTEHYNSSRGIEQAKAYLLMPHIAQVITIFRILGIGYSESKKIPLIGVIYGKKISDDLINTLVEIGTGEDMLAAIQSYQSSTYIVQNDRIVYVEGESIKENVVRGYDTIWAYYHEATKGNISLSSLETHVGIIVNCGAFSYAEMPHEFGYIAGVTGTLRTLSDSEKTILRDIYGIHKYTHMPSVFGKSNRNYNLNSDVIAVNESEYFMRIRGEIDVMCNANRAILIFFESEEKLMTFYNSTELASIKSEIQIVTEKVSVKDRELFIKRACTVGRVTLLTRTFGRGIDFICRNPQLLANGGIHVLQTFFSEELSEEYQIMGRGARQGDKGSYRMILLDKDLEWVLEHNLNYPDFP